VVSFSRDVLPSSQGGVAIGGDIVARSSRVGSRLGADVSRQEGEVFERFDVARE
jgi:hypothetical protein